MLNEFHTNIVGVTQGNRQEVIAAAKEKGIKTLYLKREPNNPVDSDAVAVVVKTGDDKYVQLGYIKNRSFQCNNCGDMLNLRPGEELPSKCPRCYSTDIPRVGLASQVAQEMDNGTEFYVTVEQYTGGPTEENPTKSYGVNVKITRKLSKGGYKK